MAVPVWISDYPKVASINETTVDIRVETDVAARVYVVILPNNAAPPSATQIKNAQNASGESVDSDFVASTVLEANVEQYIIMANLTSGTNYDVYMVAESESLELQVLATKIDILTASPSDTTPPVWSNLYPKNGIQGETTATFLVKLSEDSTSYFVVLNKDSSVPTSAQVIAGKNASNSSVATGFSGNIATASTQEGVLTASNLDYNKDYFVYIVAKDELDNIQTSPTKLEFTTKPKIANQKTIVKAQIGEVIPITIQNLTIMTSKSLDNFILGVFPATENDYEIVSNNGLVAEIKILGTIDATSRFVRIKVGDGIQVSDEYLFKISIVKDTTKTRPTSYSVNFSTPSRTQSPLQRIQ